MTIERTILAGGCFWGMEDLFRQLPGVVDTEAGYTGGHTENPTYKAVATRTTGHAEALEIVYDTEKTSFEKLLHFFFQIHDPTTLNRQGNDRGDEYRSTIFYLDEEQKKVAESVIKAIEASGQWPGPIVTTLEPASPFYRAEDEHQDYLQHYPNGYTCHWIRPNWKIEA